MEWQGEKRRAESALVIILRQSRGISKRIRTTLLP